MLPTISRTRKLKFEKPPGDEVMSFIILELAEEIEVFVKSEISIINPFPDIRNKI